MKQFFYGSHPDQFGHLYGHKSLSRRPVVVVIHGGYWKDNHDLNSYPTRAIVEYFRHYPIAIWNLEYRRMNAEGENQSAPWPAVFKDVSAGMDFLRHIAEDEHLDLSRVLVVGHSAGGHLALWTASRGSIMQNSPLFEPNPLIPSRVISVAGILDLANAHNLSQPHQVLRLIGGTFEAFPDRYEVSNPVQLEQPQTAVTIIQGKADVDVPISQAESFVQTSSVKDLRYIVLENAEHFGMLPLEGVEPPGWEVLKDVIQEEIERL